MGILKEILIDVAEDSGAVFLEIFSKIVNKIEALETRNRDLLCEISSYAEIVRKQKVKIEKLDDMLDEYCVKLKELQDKNDELSKM